MSRNAFFLVVWFGLVAWLKHCASVGSSENDEASPELNEPEPSVLNEPTPETPNPSSARLVEPLYPPKPTLFWRDGDGGARFGFRFFGKKSFTTTRDDDQRER